MIFNHENSSYNSHKPTMPLRSDFFSSVLNEISWSKEISLTFEEKIKNFNFTESPVVCFYAVKIHVIDGGTNKMTSSISPSLKNNLQYFILIEGAFSQNPRIL